MPFRNSASDWRELWTDLLQGVGRGLLELDGSRTAQAALAGLDSFETARERRRVDEHRVERLQALIARIHPGLELSAEEWAHLLRLSPDERQSWLEEMADIDHAEKARSDGREGPRAKSSMPVAAIPVRVPPGLRPSPRHRPISPNPYEGWAMASVLPIGPDGQLTIPAFRR